MRIHQYERLYSAAIAAAAAAIAAGASEKGT